MVGVFLTPTGVTLRLHLPRDPNIPLTSASESALGYWGRARWLLLSPTGDQVALRIRRLGTSSKRFERVA